MTVYVDDMRAPYRGPSGRMMKMCHMVADPEHELHDMAREIGVAARHFQKGHYDVCLSKRAEAVRRGAVPVSQRQLGCMVAVKRRTGFMPVPEEAEDAFRKLLRDKEGA
jgi:hypothetical protein